MTASAFLEIAWLVATIVSGGARYRIKASRMKWMAATQTFDGQPATAQMAVTDQCFHRIL